MESEIGQYGNTFKFKPRLTQEKIREFGEWLKKNEPVLDRHSGSGEYWELFAYRIADYLEV
jgi:hypothetical protein